MQSDPDSLLNSNQRRWLDLIRQAESSDLSLGEFAKANELNLQHLYQFRYALRKKGLLPAIDKKPLFEKISLKQSQVNSVRKTPELIMLHFPNGLRLEVSTGTDAQWLESVIKAGLGCHAAP